MSIPISAVLITKNAETFLRVCLESLLWCDEIVVIDSGSTDSTLSICSEYNCRVIHQDFLGFGAQKNFAVQHAKNDWILNLDADEVISDELKNDIQEYLPQLSNEVSVFQLPRTLIFLDKNSISVEKTDSPSVVSLTKPTANLIRQKCMKSC